MNVRGLTILRFALLNKNEQKKMMQDTGLMTPEEIDIVNDEERIVTFFDKIFLPFNAYGLWELIEYDKDKKEPRGTRNPNPFNKRPHTK